MLNKKNVNSVSWPQHFWDLMISPTSVSIASCKTSIVISWMVLGNTKGIQYLLSSVGRNLPTVLEYQYDPSAGL